MKNPKFEGIQKLAATLRLQVLDGLRRAIIDGRLAPRARLIELGGLAAMPLLALVLPMKTLVPVWTLLTISSSATLLGKDREHVSAPMILRILILSGIPLMLK